MRLEFRREVMDMASEARQLVDAWRPGTITQQDLGQMRDALGELEMLDQVPTNRKDFIALAKGSLAMQGPWTMKNTPHPLRLAVYAVLWCACRDNANYDQICEDRLRWAQETVRKAWTIRDQVAA